MGQVIEEVSFLVRSIALDLREVAVDVADRLGGGLAAVHDEQHASGGIDAAVGEIGREPGAHCGVLGAALDHAQRHLGAVVGDPRAATIGCSPNPNPSMYTTSQRRSCTQHQRPYLDIHSPTAALHAADPRLRRWTDGDTIRT